MIIKGKGRSFGFNWNLPSKEILFLSKIYLIMAFIDVYQYFSCMDVRVGLWRKLSAKELMLLNCGVGEDTWESLGLQGNPTSPFWRRSTLGFLWREWCWSWNSSTLATSSKSWLIGKDSDAGRDWGQEEKGTTENEIAGWHHWLSGCESEWTLGVGDGQEGLECCDWWGHKESDRTEQLSWTDLHTHFSRDR